MLETGPRTNSHQLLLDNHQMWVRRHETSAIIGSRGTGPFALALSKFDFCFCSRPREAQRDARLCEPVGYRRSRHGNISFYFGTALVWPTRKHLAWPTRARWDHTSPSSRNTVSTPSSSRHDAFLNNSPSSVTLARKYRQRRWNGAWSRQPNAHLWRLYSAEHTEFSVRTAVGHCRPSVASASGLWDRSLPLMIGESIFLCTRLNLHVTRQALQSDVHDSYLCRNTQFGMFRKS